MKLLFTEIKNKYLLFYTLLFLPIYIKDIFSKKYQSRNQIPS